MFGLMMSMAMPPMLGMIGSLMGAPGLGWLVHLVFSAIIGAGFGLVFGRWVTASWGQAAGLGMGYGLIWWILGPLLIMPMWMGTGPMLSHALDVSNLLSLMGHLVFGLVTGLVLPSGVALIWPGSATPAVGSLHPRPRPERSSPMICPATSASKSKTRRIAGQYAATCQVRREATPSRR